MHMHFLHGQIQPWLQFWPCSPLNLIIIWGRQLAQAHAFSSSAPGSSMTRCWRVTPFTHLLPGSTLGPLGTSTHQHVGVRSLEGEDALSVIRLLPPSSTAAERGRKRLWGCFDCLFFHYWVGKDRRCWFTIRSSMLLQILILITTILNTWKGLFIFKALCRH